MYYAVEASVYKCRMQRICIRLIFVVLRNSEYICDV